MHDNDSFAHEETVLNTTACDCGMVGSGSSVHTKHCATVIGFPATHKTLHAGDVIRPATNKDAFMDHVILGFNAQGDAKVARPYAYASGVGTTGPGPLTGVEIYTIYNSQLIHYTVIENDGHRKMKSY